MVLVHSLKSQFNVNDSSSIQPEIVETGDSQPTSALTPHPVPDTCIRSRCSPWLTSLAYPLGCWLVLPLYFGQITIVGQENLPESGPIILAPTHRSRWDAILVAAATGRFVSGRDVRFMVTIDECRGFQGWFVKRLGGFPVNPRRPSIASLRYGVELLQNEEMLVIFPEGGIFRDRQLHPLKPGLARLALQAEMSQPGLGTKIVPVTLQYDSSYPGWGSDVTIQLGQPLDVALYHQGNTKQDAKRLTADLETALQGLMVTETAEEGLPHCSS